MSLLFNMLSRFVIAFLPRGKHLLISWLQSQSAVILEPPKIKSVTVSPSICYEMMEPDAMILVFWMILDFKHPPWGFKQSTVMVLEQLWGQEGKGVRRRDVLWVELCPTERCVQVLPPRTCEQDLIQKQGLFFFLLASPGSLLDLSSLTRDWTWSWQHRVLTTGPSGNSLEIGSLQVYSS